MAAVTQNGEALKYAADTVKADKEVVMAAVSTYGPSLKYAQGGLNQDADCWKACGLWDTEADKVYSRTAQAIMSVKFSLAEKSSEYATNFALAMKEDPFHKNFKTYNPNAWCKESCDPTFTDINHPCRGSLSTCNIPEALNLDSGTKRPCSTSCWRLAFRFHQEECKATKGFMIQVEEKQGLGDGQKIETEMAREVDLKVFRTYTNHPEVQKTFRNTDYNFNGMSAISDAIKDWYANGCVNNDMENIFIGSQIAADKAPQWAYSVRPRYQKL